MNLNLENVSLSEGVLVNTHQTFCLQVRATSDITLARFGISWEEIARLADRHTQTVQRWLSSRSPQGKRFKGIGLTATSTGLKVSGLNLALGNHFPAHTPDTVIEAEINQVKSFFARQEVPFSWWLGPFATPPEMEQHLLRHGLTRHEYDLPTLVAPLDSADRWPDTNSAVQVWLAESRADLEAASTIRRRAFRFPKGSALTYFEDMADDWLRGDPAHLYLARLGDEGPPTAIGALIMGADLPGVYVMATLPKAERQGLAKALLNRLLTQAQAEGHKLIVLTAGAQAYSLYRKFGFEHIFEYARYLTPEYPY